MAIQDFEDEQKNPLEKYKDLYNSLPEQQDSSLTNAVDRIVQASKDKENPPSDGMTVTPSNEFQIQSLLKKIKGFEEPEKEYTPSQGVSDSLSKINEPQQTTAPAEQAPLIPKEQPLPSVKVADNAPPKEQSYEEMLKEAKEQQRMDNALAHFTRAGEYIGTGISRTTPDQEFLKQAGGWEDIGKQRIAGVEQLAKARELDTARKEQQDKLSPKSPISILARQFAGKMGFPVSEDTNYDTIEKAAKNLGLEKYLQAEMNRQLLTQQSKEKLEEIRRHNMEMEGLGGKKIEAGKEKTISTLDTKLQSRADKLSEKLTAEKASPRSAFGKAANIKASAERIEALISQIPDPNNLDSRQITEIARGLDAMLSQGASTISGTNKLIPHTASGDVAKIQEYISGMPKGAAQGGFVKRMLDTIQREKDLASKQMKETGSKLLSSYRDLRDDTKGKQKWDDILKANSIDDPFEETTTPSQSATPSTKMKQKPKTVIQNGHTYTLDEATGKYK